MNRDIVANKFAVNSTKIEKGQDQIQPKTVFEKIANKEIKSDIIYEDEQCIAFNDIKPQAKVHFIITPKVKNGLGSMKDASEAH